MMIISSHRLNIALIFLFLFSTVQAQVTIGSGTPPLRGALLELKDQEAIAGSGGITSETGGLMLPRVALEDPTSLQPFIPDAEATADVKVDHKGLVVYNISTDNGFDQDLYTWNGVNWERASNLALSSINGLTLSTGNTVKLGGLLTENTTINQIDNNLTFTSTTGNYSIVSASGVVSVNNDDLVAVNGKIGVNTTTPTSTLSIKGSMSGSYRNITDANSTLTADDHYVSYSGSSAGIMTLPALGIGANNIGGRIYHVKNLSVQNLTLAAASGETLRMSSGVPTVAMTIPPGAYLEVVNNGNESGSTWDTENLILTSTNGITLTNSGNILKLGGALTENTTINQGSQNLGFSATSGNYAINTATGTVSVNTDDLVATGGKIGVNTTTPASTLSIKGSVSGNYRNVTAASNALASDDYYISYSGATAGAITLLALGTGVDNIGGRIYHVKNLSSQTLTVSAAAGETIRSGNGVSGSSVTIPAACYFEFVSNGSESGVTWDVAFAAAPTTSTPDVNNAVRSLGGTVLAKYNQSTGGSLSSTRVINAGVGTYSMGTTSGINATAGGINQVLGNGYKVSNPFPGVFDITFDTPFTEIYGVSMSVFNSYAGLLSNLLPGADPTLAAPGTALSLLSMGQLAFVSNNGIRISTGSLSIVTLLLTATTENKSFTFVVTGR